MVVATKSYTNFDTKGGEKALFYWGCGHFRTFNFSDSKTVLKRSFTIYLQLVFEPKIRIIITIKKKWKDELNENYIPRSEWLSYS